MLKSIGWSVLFSHLHSVCSCEQSPAPGKGALRESLSGFLFLSFSRAWRDSGLACIAVDMTFQTFYSSFPWLEAFDQAGLEAVISALVFELGLDNCVHCPRAFLPFDASTCTYLSCLNTAWHVCLEDIL